MRSQINLARFGRALNQTGLSRRCIDTVESCSCYKKGKVAMSGPLEDGIKRWTAKRKSALVIEIIQGKTTVAEASRSYDLAPSEIENWARKKLQALMEREDDN